MLQVDIEYSQTSSNGHLSTKATSLQRPLFLADSLYIDSFVDLSTMATIVCPKVAIVERSNILYSLGTHLHP